MIELFILTRFPFVFWFVLILWMLVETVRRDRGWLRWQILLCPLFFVVVPVWLLRRRRWPVTVHIARAGYLRLVAIAAFLFVANFAVARAVTLNLYQFARVDGMSMAPTLNRQDRLIVSKLRYRTGEPQIGDIAMISYPRDPRLSFVTRIIGSAGDEIRIVDGRVYRNGQAMDDSYVPHLYRSHDHWGPQIVPEGAYFVLGDHRNNSSDSREWGYVPRENVLGRITTRWWPLSDVRRF